MLTTETNWKELQKDLQTYAKRLTQEGTEAAAYQLSNNSSNAVKREFNNHLGQSFIVATPMGNTISGRGRTGRLKSSVHPVIHDKFTFGVGAGTAYARIQELGGKTRPHIIRPRLKKVLAWGGTYAASGRLERTRLKATNAYGEKSFVNRTNFAKEVHHPGSKIKATHWMSEPMYNEIRKWLTELTHKLERPL